MRVLAVYDEDDIAICEVGKWDLEAVNPSAWKVKPGDIIELPNPVAAERHYTEAFAKIRRAISMAQRSQKTLGELMGRLDAAKIALADGERPDMEELALLVRVLGAYAK